ncbi:MAG: hypothetical protein IIY42_04960, partial [Ruminococcus sp.]|nr:hypothetical protein [Ruminococcus sp.]
MCIAATVVLAGCGSTSTNTASEATTAATVDSAKTDGIDYMALVNKTHKLPDDWEEPLETVHMTNSVGVDVEVEKKAYDAYLKLKAELEKEGVYVDLDSARRSVSDQQRIMNEFT